MITQFNLYERLGYNEEVSKLAEYVWDLYKKGERIIDLKDYCENNMTIQLNKLYIEDYNDKNNTRMLVLYNNSRYKKDKSFKIKVNKYYRSTIMSLEHELKHMYDFIKNGGDFLKVKDKKSLAPFTTMITEIKEVEIFLYCMYITEINEIADFYHSDINNFKTNKHKFKNINNFMKYSRLHQNYEYLKKHDIRELLNNISDKNKNELINLYYKIKSEDKYFNMNDYQYKYETFKDKIKKFLYDYSVILEPFNDEYSHEEIDKFFDKFIKEVDKKKKIYLNYIGRLWSYFS